MQDAARKAGVICRANPPPLLPGDMSAKPTISANNNERKSGGARHTRVKKRNENGADEGSSRVLLETREASIGKRGDTARSGAFAPEKEEKKRRGLKSNRGQDRRRKQKLTEKTTILAKEREKMMRTSDPLGGGGNRETLI